MVSKETKSIVIVIVIACCCGAALIYLDNMDRSYHPEVKVYKNITVGERFPGRIVEGGTIISKENEQFLTVNQTLFWEMVPSRNYQIELTYNWSPLNRINNTATLTGAIEIK
jgi:hypothetical protein